VGGGERGQTRLVILSEAWRFANANRHAQSKDPSSVSDGTGDARNSSHAAADQDPKAEGEFLDRPLLGSRCKGSPSASLRGRLSTPRAVREAHFLLPQDDKCRRGLGSRELLS
jgi:hypothetical protein